MNLHKSEVSGARVRVCDRTDPYIAYLHLMHVSCWSSALKSTLRIRQYAVYSAREL